jgi:hypothetical protein
MRISFFEFVFLFTPTFSGTQMELGRRAGCNVRGIKISKVVAR